MKYICETCDYNTQRHSQYKRHLLTSKHINRTNRTESSIKSSAAFECDCGKKYTARNSLWYHKNKCTYISSSSHESIPNDFQELKTMFIDLLNHNNELQSTIKEMIPRIGNTTYTNSHNNNTFNIQMFLENECKNAISIQDFIKSIEINTSHLIAMSKDGYVDSISNVLIQALNKLAITDRPLHCTDLKRETVYIKDMENWNKSTADTSIMNKVITNIENKHLLEVKNYIVENPESQVLDTPENTFYHKVHWNSLGAGEDSEKLNKKIYKKVLPGVKLEQPPAI